MTGTGPMRSRWIDTVVFLVLGAIVGSVFFVRFPLPLKLLSKHVVDAGAALVVLAASATCGSVAFRFANQIFAMAWHGGTGECKPDSRELALVGIPVFGTLVAAIAWIGIRIDLLVPLVTCALAVPCLTRIVRGGMPLRPGLPPRALLVLAIPVAFGLIEAMSPVSSPDELIYKLAVPHAYLEWGSMVELPLNSNSYFPNAVYMADSAAMTLRGGSAARMLHFLILLLALRVAWRLGDAIREGAGSWVAATFAWTPAIMLIGGWAWAEWAMLGLLLLSWHRWWRFVQEDGEPRDAAIAALALAGALATKYTAGIWTVVFVPFALVMVRRTRREAAFRIAAAAAAVLCVFGGFFYVRNIVWTGSPLAPFGLPGSPAVTNFRSEHGGLYELLMGWDIFHQRIIDDALGLLLPIAVLASPLAILRLQRRHLAFFAFGLVQTCVLAVIAPTSRLILLGLAPLAVLGAVAACETFGAADRARRFLLGGVVAFGFVGQLVLAGYVLQRSYEPFGVLTGGESEGAYLERMRDYVPAFRWIESNTPPESVVLMLGESRPYHLDRRAHWAGNLDGPRVAAWLARSPDSSSTLESIRALGVTHVLIHKRNYVVGEMATRPPTMLEKEFVLVVPARIDEVLRACLRDHARLDYVDKTYLLFTLR